MASHISYPLIDPTKKPASFSSMLIQNVLRKGLGFTGVLLTDDIQMGGAKMNYMSVGERAVQAVLAGNDLVMVGWNYRVQRAAVSAVLKAAKSGRISKERLNQSLRRLLTYKMQFYKKPSTESLKKVIGRIPLKKTYDRIFQQVFKSQAPGLNINNKRVHVYSYSWHFLTSYKERHTSRLYHLKNHKSWNKSINADYILYHLSGPTTAKILKTAPPKIRKKMIVVNSSSQIFLSNEEAYAKVINIHSFHPKLGQFAAHHLAPTVKAPNVRNPASND